MKGHRGWVWWIVSIVGVALVASSLARGSALGSTENVFLLVLGVGLILGGLAAILATKVIRTLSSKGDADPRVARFVPPAALLVCVAGVGALGGVIFFIGAASSADTRDFLAIQFASIRRNPKRFLAAAKEDQRAAYRAIAASSSERFEPFATFNGTSRSSFHYDDTYACVDGELIDRDQARPIAAVVVGDSPAGRLELRITEIGVDRRCKCHGGGRNDPIGCSLE